MVLCLMGIFSYAFNLKKSTDFLQILKFSYSENASSRKTIWSFKCAKIWFFSLHFVCDCISKKSKTKLRLPDFVQFYLNFFFYFCLESPNKRVCLKISELILNSQLQNFRGSEITGQILVANSRYLINQIKKKIWKIFGSKFYFYNGTKKIQFITIFDFEYLIYMNVNILIHMYTCTCINKKYFHRISWSSIFL